jgi:ketosteroid isomerase-like protein
MMSQANQPQTTHVENPGAAVERIYHEWDAALARNDSAALLALYAPDAMIESPLIPHLIGSEHGICRGHDEIRPFFEALARRKPQVRRYYRTGYLTDGKKLMWEYPRASPDGDQMDFVEVIEIKDGLIQSTVSIGAGSDSG